MGNKLGRRSLIVEITSLTVILLVITRVMYLARGIGPIGSLLPAIVAVLFLYGPIIVLWQKKRKIDFLDRGVRDYVRSAITFLVTAIIVFIPFLLLAHAWQIVVFKYSGFRMTGFPGFWNALAFQVFLVALPEEFYFRGYFQSAMNRITERKWRILGVQLGWGWIITALVFAIAHSIVTYKWWHFSIFFPALLFGYLRERTGSITAPILFHAMSNLLMDWFVRCYH